LRSGCQSRAQESPEREALNDESESFDDQNRSDSDLEPCDGPAGRKEQMDIEHYQHERNKPAQPSHVRRPD
jgi:hypothetical protein